MQTRCVWMWEVIAHSHTRIWEAWEVKKGQRLDVNFNRFNYTDLVASETPPDNTCGQYFYGGTIKFFCKADRGHLGTIDTRVGELKNSWHPVRVQDGCGGTAGSGGLPATTTEPTWWNSKAIEGPASRSLDVNWSCCCNRTATATATASPSP